MQRIRAIFSKTGALRYIGHLDLQTIWERAARRAGLSLTYTQGFHPQPRINLASALPLGYSSRCEVADIRLNEDVWLTELPGRLQAAMPAGIGILSVETVAEQAPSLQSQVTASEFEVRLRGPSNGNELERRIEKLLAEPKIPRERRGKEYDLRPLIEALELEAATAGATGGAGSSAPPATNEERIGEMICLRMRLSAREGATGRPEEVLHALGLAPDEAHIERTRLIFRE